MLALALGVWGLGAISATALAYDLGRSPTPRAPTVPAIHKDAPEVVRQPARTLSIPPITIVGRRIVARPAGAAGVAEMQKPEELPDLSRMHCGDARELQMGSGRVQTCE